MSSEEILRSYLEKTDDPKAQEVFDIFQNIDRNFGIMGKKFNNTTRWDFFIECIDFLKTKHPDKFSNVNWERLDKNVLDELLQTMIESVSQAQSVFMRGDYYGAESLALACFEKTQQILVLQGYILNQVHFIERQN